MQKRNWASIRKGVRVSSRQAQYHFVENLRTSIQKARLVLLSASCFPLVSTQSGLPPTLLLSYYAPFKLDR